jgi:hypothetical protein
MKRFNGYFLFLLFTLLSLSACIKQEKYPDTPQIGLLNFIPVYDTGEYAVLGYMRVSFTDGDGDLGLWDRDTLPPYEPGGPYYYNYVITFFAKQHGIYQQIDLDPPFSARIPVLNPDYPGKAIKGIITDTINLELVPHSLYDTIRFDAFLYDRALNKSNVISTPDIVLKRPY